MPLGQCVWCGRYRIVRLRTWSSRRNGAQLCGEVCEHCYTGEGAPDDCRTCRAKVARGQRVGRQTGVRPLGTYEALKLLEMQGARRARRDV